MPSMPAPVDLLRRVPIFQNLERRDLERIARSLKERTFGAGQTVTTEGQGGVGFFVIESGEATVTQAGEERGKIRSGDHFGEIALIGETDRTATVTADTDLKCWGMTFWEFRPLVEENSTIAWNMLQSMAKMLSRQQAQTQQP
jgi:CRP/FNR family transcriptional regulator, cyclic AMP receptor protein